MFTTDRLEWKPEHRPDRRPRPRIARAALLLLLGSCAWASGCTSEKLADEWAVTLGQLIDQPLAVVDAYPAEGSAGIGHKIQPYVLFNRPLREEERRLLSHATLQQVDSGTERRAALDLDPDSMGLSVELNDLARSSLYQLDLALPGLELRSARFETSRLEGDLFNMSEGLDVESFGGEPSHAQLLNDLFVPGVYPLWVLELREPSGLGLAGPSDLVNLAFAPGMVEPEEAEPFYLHRSFGLVSELWDVEISDEGWLAHEQASLFLPLWSGEDVFVLHLDAVQLSGRLRWRDGVPAFDALRLVGVLGTRALLDLAESGPQWRAAVDGLKLDVDTNGNGVPDAATFQISSHPRRLDSSEVNL